MRTRVRQHFYLLLAGKHSNNALQESFNVYGVEEFKVEVIQECNSPDRLERIEQHWFNITENKFNIVPPYKGKCPGIRGPHVAKLNGVNQEEMSAHGAK